jgi:hypothetical protein
MVIFSARDVDHAIGQRHDFRRTCRAIDDCRSAAACRSHHGDPMALGRFLSAIQRRQLEQRSEHFDAQYRAAE